MYVSVGSVCCCDAACMYLYIILLSAIKIRTPRPIKMPTKGEDSVCLPRTFGKMSGVLVLFWV